MYVQLFSGDRALKFVLRSGLSLIPDSNDINPLRVFCDVNHFLPLEMAPYITNSSD